MPYRVGAKGSYGCDGYPAVKDDGTVMGCHKTKGAAARQIYAINISEGNIDKAMIKEGDMVMAPNDDEVYVGRVVHVMTEGMLGTPGSEYALVATSTDPAILIQLFEMEEGGLEETEYFIGAKSSEVMAMPSLESNTGMDKNFDEISKSYHSENEEEDKWDNMSKACWVGYEQQGMKEKDGRMVPNCVPVSKLNEVEKAKSVSVGDHVSFAVPKPPDKTESAHGVVERVERSGKVTLPGTNETVEASSDNPVAVVRVYATDENGKMTRTDRRVAKPVSSLRVYSEPINDEKMYDEDEEMEKVSAKLESRLRELVENYNKGKEGDNKITIGTLRQVYNRGIGAYRSNPSSVRGSVSSAEQWAMGRVNAFMAGLRGRFPRKPFDLDLFPKGHSRSTKKYLFEGFGKEINSSQKLTEVFKMEKREFSETSRERMAESGNAMPDGSFPIANRADLMNAIRSVGRAKDYNKAKAHIIRRAKELNATDMLPEDWNNMTRKGMTGWGGSVFDLNPFKK